MFLYLLHFDEPLHHAKHYLGVTDDLTKRLIAHANGEAAKLTSHLKTEHLEWRIIAAWETRPNMSGRDIERLAKRQKNSPRFCHECRYPLQPLAPMKSKPIALWQVGDFPLTSKELREWHSTKLPTSVSLSTLRTTLRRSATLPLE